MDFVFLSLVFSQRTKTVTYVMSPCLGRQLMTSDTKPGKTSKIIILKVEDNVICKTKTIKEFFYFLCFGKEMENILFSPHCFLKLIFQCLFSNRDILPCAFFLKLFKYSLNARDDYYK